MIDYVACPIQGVFTSLIENLGVKDVQFEELISLDADTIRSLRYDGCTAVSYSTTLTYDGS